jgi:hypothetical protein
MIHVSASDGGLALTILGPLTATVPLPFAGGPTVTVVVDTEYPFGDDLNITLTGAPAGTPFYIRVPGWATQATLSVNGSPAASLAGQNGTMYRVVLPEPNPDGTHVLAYALNPQIFVDSIGATYAGAISVHRGALLYGMQIGESVVNVTQNHTTVPGGPVIQDYELNSTSTWNVALVYDPSDPAGPSKFFTFNRAGPVNPALPFDHSQPPLTITAQAREVFGWGINLGSAAAPPASPACSAAGACSDQAFTVTFVPFGMTNLRMSVLPWTPQ